MVARTHTHACAMHDAFSIMSFHQSSAAKPGLVNRLVRPFCTSYHSQGCVVLCCVDRVCFSRCWEVASGSAGRNLMNSPHLPTLTASFLLQLSIPWVVMNPFHPSPLYTSIYLALYSFSH